MALLAHNRTFKGEEHHFFASSCAEWRADDDLAKLIRFMMRQGFPFNVYKVPGPVTSSYRIEDYRPIVDGATWITSYRKAPK